VRISNSTVLAHISTVRDFETTCEGYTQSIGGLESDKESLEGKLSAQMTVLKTSRERSWDLVAVQVRVLRGAAEGKRVGVHDGDSPLVRVDVEPCISGRPGAYVVIWAQERHCDRVVTGRCRGVPPCPALHEVACLVTADVFDKPRTSERVVVGTGCGVRLGPSVGGAGLSQVS
jgi:hypothetical protein